MGKQNKQFAYEEVKRFIEVESNSECKLLSKYYFNANSNLKIQCQCGKDFEATFAKFKFQNKRQCNDCGEQNRINKRRKGHNDFLEEVYDLVGEEYTVLSKYKTTHEHIKIKHNICNHEYDVSPANFLRGKRCPKCNGGVIKSHEEFLLEFEEISDGEFELLSKYINNRTKIKVKHNKCGFEYEVVPYGFLRGDYCPLCSGYYKNTDIFKEEVNRLVGNEFEVISEYVSAKDKIKIKHNECGKVFKTTPNDFKNGNRCPYCRQSKGEKLIELYLMENEISYKRQFRIKECKNKRALPFDFAIFNSNGNLKCLIEFDGRQHFESIKFRENSNYSNLEYIQNNDDIKRKYCEDNNIRLIEIPYWDKDNIENILNGYFRNQITA